MENIPASSFRVGTVVVINVVINQRCKKKNLNIQILQLYLYLYDVYHYIMVIVVTG